MSTKKPQSYGLYDPTAGSDSCGVGFITRKDGEQTHEILQMAHSALCTVPHRGGMSAEGVGDGAGVNVCLLYTSPSPRDLSTSRMPSSA